MGELGDYWRDVREHRRAVRRQAMAEDETVTVPGDWTEHHETHRSRVLCGDRLDWWPTARRWRWRGRTHNGPAIALVGFIANREREAARCQP